MGEALVEGTKGTLELKGDGSVQLRQFGSLKTKEMLPASTFDGFGGDCVFALQSHVVAALNGRCDLENTVAEYLTVMALEEAIYRSSEQGGYVEI